MTVIAAYTTKDECWMAHDSASSSPDSVLEVVTPKVIKHAGGGLIGSSGSWLLINAISALQKKKCEVGDIVDLVKSIKEGPFPSELEDITVLMVWPGRPIVCIYENSSFMELKSSFAAIGSGQDYALGYLEGVEKIGTAEMKKAVEVAAKYSTSVGKPAKVLHCVKGEK